MHWPSDMTLSTTHVANANIPLRRILSPWGIVAHLHQRRNIIYQFTKRDVLGRYRGTYLGILLSLLRPLFMLFVFTGVFGYIFGGTFGHHPNESKLDYALALFCGLVLFNFAAECFSRAPTLVLVNPNYVTRVVFPLEIMAVSVVGAGLIHLGISLIDRKSVV